MKRCNTVVRNTSQHFLKHIKVRMLNFDISATKKVSRIWSFLTYLWIPLCSVNRSCRKGFRPCYNHRCVANSRFCDGIDDCGDNSDEAYCSSESYSFDLTFKLSYVSGQDPATLMLKWIWHTRPHAVPSLHCLMSTKIIKSTNSKRLLTLTLKNSFWKPG